MAARLTDRQKKKIIADYVDLESYHAVASKHKIAVSTVKRICDNSVDMKQKATQKKEQNTQDILDYMELKKDAVTQVIGRYRRGSAGRGTHFQSIPGPNYHCFGNVD